MTRGRYYSTVMPIWAIVYVIGLIAFHGTAFAIAGAFVFVLLGLIGTAVLRPGASDRSSPGGAAVDGRKRGDRAARRAARRGYAK